MKKTTLVQTSYKILLICFISNNWFFKTRISLFIHIFRHITEFEIEARKRNKQRFKLLNVNTKP